MTHVWDFWSTELPLVHSHLGFFQSLAPILTDKMPLAAYLAYLLAKDAATFRLRGTQGAGISVCNARQGDNPRQGDNKGKAACPLIRDLQDGRETSREKKAFSSRTPKKEE